MTKNILFVFTFLTCFPLALQSQSGTFEGEIQYAFKFHDNTGAMPDQQSVQLFGTEQAYSIKGGKYRSEMNGLLRATQVYTGGDTLYNLMKGVNAILFIQANINPDSLISYEIKPVQEKIAGHICDLLEIKSTDGLLQCWFSRDVRVNPADFQHHAYGFWKLSLELTDGALPLKSITDTKKTRMEIVATAVKARKVDDSQFALPAGLPLVPSPE